MMYVDPSSSRFCPQVTNQWASHSKAFPFTVNVAQSQVDVRTDALHGLNGQRTSQVLGIGAGCGQTETEPVEHTETENLSSYCPQNVLISDGAL